MLVSFQELKTYSGISKWSPAAEDGAALVLAGLQGELEAYLRRPIETEVFTETYVVQVGTDITDEVPFYSVYAPTVGIVEYGGYGSVAVPFRNSPVASIQSVGTFCPSSGFVSPIERSAGTWVQERWGVEFFNATPGSVIQVSYTAGLEWDKPGALAFFKLLILRAATRETSNLYDQNVGKQNFEGDPERAIPIGFTQAELDSARRYRRQRI